MKDFLWVERYRPRTVAECILPERIKALFAEFVKKEEIPNLLLSGSAGVGKTTLAMACCDEAKIPHTVINASRERGIDVIRETLTNYGQTMAFSGKRKVAILDEADNLTDDAQKTLRGVMEEFSHNLTYILTCNFKRKIMEPIHSRCIAIDFTLTGDEEQDMSRLFMKRLMTILKKENVPFQISAIVAIVEHYFPDFRRALNELQGFAARGEITDDTTARLGKIGLEELYATLLAGNFTEMRNWVGANADIDPNYIYKQIYYDLYELLEKPSIPPAVILLAAYQYKHALVANPDINLAACLTELMGECTFKK